MLKTPKGEIHTLHKGNKGESFINSILGRLLLMVITLIILGITLLGRVFYLQIIHGEEALENFTLKIQKERNIEAARGNIYDCNGKVLAYNVLAYNVTIEDTYESGKDKNRNINETLMTVIDMIERNGDHVIGDFNIIVNENNEFEFTVSDTKRKRFLADIFGRTQISDLKYEEETATANDVMMYLCGYGKFGIGISTDPENPRDSFIAGSGYTNKEILKLVTIRYAMSLNSYQKYIPTVIASNVNEKTVAIIMENVNELQGISIAEDNIRKYNNSVYFAHILGYTGKISEDELISLNNQEITEENSRTTKNRNDYIITDRVGKAGIEQTMETYLAGTKGAETVYVNNLGKVIESKKSVVPVAGNDVYLTIDSDLQIATYNILEQYLAGILVKKIQNVKEFNPDDIPSASNYYIPITDVYFTLFNNNIIDINHLGNENALENEKAVYQAIVSKKESVLSRLEDELTYTKTPYMNLNDEYKVYESYITTMLSENGITKDSEINKEDGMYLAWKVDETISLYEYLQYAISMNWIDVTKINLESSYADSTEVYARLVEYIIEHLNESNSFTKKMLRYMILNDNITARQICTILIEQDAVSIIDSEKNKFLRGATAPYDFIIYLIANLYLTPGQLALDPSSASCVITTVDGTVKALVTYPSYDNNRLANSIDADYYARLQADLSKPLWNHATQEKTAPGSTFKMVSSTAALTENLLTSTSIITCKGYFDRFSDAQYHCWVYPGSHGSLNVTGAIENSCNCFFYEVGYQFSMVDDKYNEKTGLDKINKYASLYGLNEKSGIEIEESIPELSDELPVLSAIGQGTNNYTTVGLARYVTAVANSGAVYDLTLLQKITDSNNNIILEYSPTLIRTVDLPNAHWNAIHKGMRNVALKKAYYNNLGVSVAGKTGTAQESKKRTNHALFVSYAPFESPEITISTRIPFGYTSDYAANVTSEIYKYYYGLEDEDNILTGTAAVPDIVVTHGD